jgi:hypothetical protein
MLVSDVIDQARVLLQDNSTPYRYSDSNFLGFVNQALSRMAMLRPDLFTVIEDVPLVASSVLQQLPIGGVRLVELFSVSGNRALLEVNREMMDMSSPTWVAETPGTPVNYARHVRNPTKFFVYPPPTSGLTVSCEYVKSPTIYTDTYFPISELPNIYLPVLIDCVVFLAESQDDEHINSGRAKLYYDSFVQSLGVNLQLRPLTDTEDAGLSPQPGYVRPQRQVI